MAMSLSLLEYLEWTGVDYDIIKHPRTACSMETAEMAHIPGDQLAKGVVLHDDHGYVMAVVPATHKVHLGRLHRQLNRALGLATEQEIETLFDDCEAGAVPPLGMAFGYDVIIDDSLTACPDVYLEAGDHRDLIHLSGQDFRELMAKAPHGQFSRHV